MKILITGANGYIGSRLTQVLLEMGHELYCLVRNPERISDDRIHILVGDLSKGDSIFPKDIDAAYYLVHSMSKDPNEFDKIDRICAENFVKAIEKTRCQQTIYLTGLVSDNTLSKHLRSRFEVETILKNSSIPLTALRAGIIIGSGSASFEIIRDLVEKLPIMIAPRWVSNLCQPIAIADVIEYLVKVLLKKECLGQSFDIGGEDVLTYKELLLLFAKKRKLHRLIISVPIFTPKLSSYWLFFITSTSFPLARALVESLKNNAVCRDFRIRSIIPKKLLSYPEALDRAFQKIDENAVVSSWRDAWSSSNLDPSLGKYMQIPTYGCYKYAVREHFKGDPKRVLDAIFHIGGKRGWYSMNWAWRIRGFIDRFFGGVGLHRGKINRRIKTGDAIDFWRVLLADEKNYRLLLYAEMKLPGEAWLEFVIDTHSEPYELIQIATFRPSGVFGRLYWWFFYPFHLIIFPGMVSSILKNAGAQKL